MKQRIWALALAAVGIVAFTAQVWSAERDAPETWEYGDLEAGFKEAALVLDETYVTPDTSHQTLETRTVMAYWQNGKVHV